MFQKAKFLYNVVPENEGGGASLTKEAIDKQNLLRTQLGQEPLPYPVETEGATEQQKLSQIEQFKADKLKELTENNPSGLTPEEIENEAKKLVEARAAEIEVEQNAEKERLRKEAEKTGASPIIKIGSKEPVKVQQPQKTEVPNNKEDESDVDESVLLKQLSKKAGREITSLEDFLNPKTELSEEEKNNQAQERESAKVAFGLQKKIISKNEIESFIADTRDLQGVALEFYTKQQLALDETLTEKEIKDNFEEEYGLNEDTESMRYKVGQQNINFIANSIISKKHSKYLNLESAFSEYENEQNAQQQKIQKIAQLTPSYKKDVDTVINSISKIKIGNHEVVLESELLDNYRSQMLDPKHSEILISRGWTLEDLQKSTRNHVIIENIDSIVSGILEAEKLKYQAGQRGIIPPKNNTAKILNDVQADERSKLQERLGLQTN